MQQMFPGFGELSAQPLKHNFASYLKAQDLSKSEIEKIIYKLESDESIKSDRTIYYAVTFALETIKSVNKPSNRDVRKLECYYLYQQLTKTKMKRSEIVWTIANKMGVNKDCIQVYLRELFSS